MRTGDVVVKGVDSKTEGSVDSFECGVNELPVFVVIDNSIRIVVL